MKIRPAQGADNRVCDVETRMAFGYVSVDRYPAMRTQIDVEDELLAEAMRATGLSNKSAVVEEALRQLITDSRRQALREMSGLGWDGDLDEMRRNSFRSFDE